MKRTTGLLLALLMLLSGTLALAEEKPAIEVTFWNGFTGADGQVLTEIVNRYNEENDKGIFIKMDIIPWNVFEEKVPPSIATNTAPDFFLLGSGNYGSYYKNAALQPLDAFWDVEGVNKEDFTPAVLDMFTIDGKLYGIPMQTFCKYLFWNKDTFKAAGLDPEVPPTTYEELVDFAIRLSSQEENRYGLAIPSNDSTPVLHMMLAQGGKLVDQETMTAVLNSDVNIAVFEDLRKMVVDHKVSPLSTTGGEFDSILLTGAVAMTINGPWVSIGFENNGINYGIAQVPGGIAGQHSEVNGSCFCIPVSTTDPAKLEAIYDFIAHWNTVEVGKTWSLRNGFPPYLKSVAADPEIQANARVSKMAEAMSFSQPLLTSLGIHDEVLNNVLCPAIEKVMSGADAKDTLNEYNEVLADILKSL